MSDPDAHEAVRMLLPWYVSGALEDGDREMVEAHLAGCEGCRAEASVERGIRHGVARTPMDVELGWADMRRRLAAAGAPRQGGVIARFFFRPRLIGLAIAAQLLLLLGAVAAFSPLVRPASYRMLSAPEAPHAGNVLVMFRPEATVSDVQQLLEADGARIVDGPTAAGAWVVQVPVSARMTALARLRAQGAVTLAEPIDP